MTYIENIFICLAIPLGLSLLFMCQAVRRHTVFVLVGMLVCLLSAYVSSFFMNYYEVDSVIAAVEITPVVEEFMQVIPLIFYILILEPESDAVLPAAIAIATGFATFENVCYLTENGADNLTHLLMRGISAGALHILCGIIMGSGMAYVFNKSWLALTGTVGLVGVCVTLHGIYNVLIVADGRWSIAGYIGPSILILAATIGHTAGKRLKDRKQALKS